VHNLKLKQITIALCVALMPISSFAAGLGKLNVTSALGEPLTADIELISVTPAELENITAAIASEETYATQGLEKPASHTGIKVEVGKNASGAPVLKLRSAQAINDPFLDMLIQVDWATGRLLREYTVLLDPPGYTGEQAPATASTVDSPVVAASPNAEVTRSNADVQSTASEEKPVTKKGKSKKAAKKNPEQIDVVEPAMTGAEYTTERGDTLMKIARDMKPEGVSLEQMLVGLYETNPEAFSGKNMNRLKVGQIVRQPSPEALSAISKGEAQREIRVQAANWNEYRKKLAGMVADAPVAAPDNTVQSSSGKIKGAAEDKSVASANGPKDVVKLSATESGQSKDAKSAEAKIAALQEEATARENSVKEAQSRAADLEKQISDMQKLLALKNNAMADLQKQSAAKAAEPAKPVETAKPAEVPTPVAQPTAPVETKPAEVSPPAAEVAKPTPTPTPAVAPTPPAVKPVAKPAPIPPAPVEEEGFVSSVLSSLDMTTLLPVGGLLAALGGGWLFLRNRRKRNLADFEQGIMTSGGLKANTVFGNTSGASVDTGDTSFLTDFSQSGSAGMIDTNDVDPIAEAEVYMAYGRDAQAEEILKDAIVKEPKRYELHLKLLEMYAASQNNSAFEAISGELYTTLGADSPVWAKVAEIGIQLEPNNPLYQAGTTAIATQENTSTSKSSSEKLDIADFSDIPLADESDLDQSSDQLTKVRGSESAKAEADATSEAFDLDFGSDELSPVGTSELASADSMSFEAPTADAPPPVVAETTVNDLNFDMGDLGLQFKQPVDEPAPIAPVATISEVAEVPVIDLSGFSENSLDVDTITEEMEAKTVLAPDTIDLDVNTAVFPATFAPNELDKPAEALADLSDAFADDNKNLTESSISEQAADFMKADFNDANVVDISNISLDLNDEAAEVGGEEPADVETKLELVAAYIDMDDAEGAKELIAEVMAEGGANQRKRAEALLAKLA
jgi:pilus assembly protein FimV